ncbi:MAG TPA: tRNA epoxyqueuosine(34) reductase QueG [Acidimicrobiales bacterium]|nr:tRNA epoxyqueuosine(34) reductase QueG [Acidimicrobiales bacterium]
MGGGIVRRPGRAQPAPAPAARPLTATLTALAEELVALGRDAGLDAVGIAPAQPFLSTRRIITERRDAGLDGGMQFTYRNPERATDPDRALPGAQALVVGARRYKRADVAPPTPGPMGSVARYSWHDHYADLRAALSSIADRVVADGFTARVLADDNALVDREAAYRAGLGWYGKNTNLLLPGRGSWFVLGAVVTDAPLPTAASLPDGCGTCDRCLPACPTGALIAPGVLDARRCLAWLLQAPGVFPRQWRDALGDRLYGCDDCQDACPANRLDERREPSPPADAADEPWVPLLEILSCDEATLLERWGRWYIAERRPAYLLRNALLALANVGNGEDPAVAHAITDALGHPDGLVRAHAVWAAARLGLTRLLHLVADDADPAVRDELDALPAARR